VEFDHRLIDLEQLQQSIYPGGCSPGCYNGVYLLNKRSDSGLCCICGLDSFLHPSTLKDMRWKNRVPDGFVKEIYFLYDHDAGGDELTEATDRLSIHEQCSKGILDRICVKFLYAF